MSRVTIRSCCEWDDSFVGFSKLSSTLHSTNDFKLFDTLCTLLLQTRLPRYVLWPGWQSSRTDIQQNPNTFLFGTCCLNQLPLYCGAKIEPIVRSNYRNSKFVLSVAGGDSQRVTPYYVVSFSSVWIVLHILHSIISLRKNIQEQRFRRCCWPQQNWLLLLKTYLVIGHVRYGTLNLQAATHKQDTVSDVLTLQWDDTHACDSWVGLCGERTNSFFD